MTIEAIKKMDCDFITAAEAAQVIGADPQSIREQARVDKSKLGFPVVVIGCRLRIPRLPFIAFVTEATGKGGAAS